MATPATHIVFICPHCRNELRVSSRYLGQRGRCNKCGGRIALIGREEAESPQMASEVVDDIQEQENGTAPATKKQLAYLHLLDVSDDDLKGITCAEASRRIASLKKEREVGESPTEKQRGYLQRLGATSAQLGQIKTKSDASRLIEEMHLSPTRKQLELLNGLGASGAQIARLKTKADASALIDALIHTE